MHDAPSQKEMIQAVKAFIDNTAMPSLKGHAAFHARVASNVLATVLREMDIRPEAESEEVQRLTELLGTEPGQSAVALNKLLCEQIRSGEMSLTRPGLLSHLKTTTIAQLSVDQPGYSGLKTS
ncbi:DUF6285 domain-containing protein [Hyphomonas pacifica]|uniref:Uncharacterized protein n=1 Tax=Hyphomonas pacifica TaxID=1280941 RepID=A0A062TSF5_9PROT|nr:DUF6285 domain-containing protein [Hyphomonas pacifica]KCZ50751.1 hypothetical protein HY2_02545 [Hyphomonas pacifica]RAN34456.1 hypothetical protein HY3_10815 [Hyphomonas pacifica]RAN34969.1 hypothetical protein HY11_02945 [Hyphomonas pacifica]